ncbi:hypothetical protein Ami103574_04630 [Aminipila butyrica]|uniref:Uncharacterized protein n=1 Tax=Aminipila butyrica TaxID=433296 RepID=A0A858BU95_9FIRM|nr:hypothetical protein [Aminipila butyrica]QIB68648.1 hypothetical protein Ami103574_04630 [Aminipila butyrica]
MGICLINKYTDICERIVIFTDMSVAEEMFGDTYILTEQVTGFNIGDIYQDGTWSKVEVYPEEKEANKEEDTLIMMIDQEYRITKLELGIYGERGENSYDLQNHKKNDRKGFSRWFGRKA